MPCEQPPAKLVPAYPTGEGCAGAVEEVRTCIGLQQATWVILMQGLYEGEVQKRATEDMCLAKLRKTGAIK